LSKYIQDQIFKSRLTITYRTNITGTPQQEKLPYRLLVLGELEGRSKRSAGLLPPLVNRSVRSIKRGTTVDDHLNEVVPTWHLPKDQAFNALRSVIPGKIKIERLVCTIPRGAVANKTPGSYPFSGKARFESDEEMNGFGHIDGDIVIRGSLKVDSIDDAGEITFSAATLSLSGIVVGDALDRATKKKLGLITGVLINHEVSVASDMLGKPTSDDDDDDGASAGRKYVFATTATPSLYAERTVPFASMKDFSPDAVAASIPELHRLRVLKSLIHELQSTLRNRTDLRNQMKTALKSPDALKQLREWAKTSYPELALKKNEGGHG